mmetsp:Transcript_13009/g.28143  ORF Transcript_13009/g.28143 Transcript_13009/m.28143 type:complete len:158 (-) Transcript_13009:1948-2421(-)
MALQISILYYWLLLSSNTWALLHKIASSSSQKLTLIGILKRLSQMLALSSNIVAIGHFKVLFGGNIGCIAVIRPASQRRRAYILRTMAGMRDTGEGSKLTRLFGSVLEPIPVHVHAPKVISIIGIRGRTLLELDDVDGPIDILIVRKNFVINHLKLR